MSDQIPDKPKNKGGRPKGSSAPTIRAVLKARLMFEKHAEDALAVMVHILNDSDAEDAVRLKAANDILNRAYGTPVSVSLQHKIVSEDRESPISTGAISSAGTAELQALAQTLARFIESERDTIDITPTMPDGYPDS